MRIAVTNGRSAELGVRSEERGVKLSLDGDREVQKGRALRRVRSAMEFSFDRLIDDLLDVRATAAAAKSSTGRPRDFASRRRAIANESANLSVGDSAAMADEHSGLPSFWTAGF
jgi:hypothetical protein